MNETSIQTLSLTIDKIDMDIEGDTPWTKKFIKKMNNNGFSMDGGFYIQFSVGSDDDDTCLMSYVPVARRIKPVLREAYQRI